MQSIIGEVHSILKELDKISFSKEVAETLGLESAIILELYQNNKISNSKEINKLIASVKDHAPFLEENCLLYTSPSPRDQRGSRMASSG